MGPNVNPSEVERQKLVARLENALKGLADRREALRRKSAPGQEAAPAKSPKRRSVEARLREAEFTLDALKTASETTWRNTATILQQEVEDLADLISQEEDTED